jgi:hypothetical protein
MGAALSKLWGAFLRAWTGGGAPTNNHAQNNKDLEDGLPTANTPAKPPTPLPDMTGIKKYEITEVCPSAACPLAVAMTVAGRFWRGSSEAPAKVWNLFCL